MDNFREACLASCEKWVSSFSYTQEFEFSRSFEKQMNILIDKMRKNKYHRFTRKTIRALIAAAVIMSLAATALALPGSREYIVEQFIDHFSYDVAETNDVKIVDSLVVGYIPEGFEKATEYNYDNEYGSEYTKGDNWFTVSKCTINSKINIDISQTEIKTINGTEYLLFTTDNTNGVIWNNGSYIYTVSGAISKDEILKIALNTN